MADAPARWFRLRDRAAYLPEPDALVLADLHLGRDAASNVAFPLGERERLAERLAALLGRFEPATVVFAGDVLHEFSSVPDGIEDAVDTLRRRVEAQGAALVVVEGNHDAMLPSLVGTVAEHELADGTVVCHGHEEPAADAERYVIGHQHPALEIEGTRRHPALLGEAAYRGADVLVLPAFNGLAAGTPLNGLDPGAVVSPLIESLRSFRPIVRDPAAGETLAFPPLGTVEEFL